MIQSILLFALGFLTAGLLALMIAPAIWRRAVRLTRKRVEASAPLSMAEIQAEKDRVRAEFAMSARRLEIGAKASREKAAVQIIELNRNREELKSMSQQRMDETDLLAELSRRVNELQAEVRRKDDHLQRLAEKLAAAEILGQQLETELEKLGVLYDEASFTSSSRQIELVARESQIDRLRGDVAMFRDRGEEAEARVKKSTEEGLAIANSIELETKRAADLQAKIDVMFATLADSDEKLGKRDRELLRLREKLHSASSAKRDKAESPEPGMVSDRALFEKTLTTLTRENRKMKEDLTASQSSAAGMVSDRELSEMTLTALIRENQKIKEDLAAAQSAAAGMVSDREVFEKRLTELTRESKKTKEDLAAAQSAAAGMVADRELFEKRLTELTRESEKIKEDLTASQSSAAGMVSAREMSEKRQTELTRANLKIREDLAAARSAAGNDARDGAALREQMNDLAAQVVALTAKAEGADSPIEKALAAPIPKPLNDVDKRVASLAERVRALQKAGSAT